MSSKYPGMPVLNIDHFKRYEESPTEFTNWTKLPETRLTKPNKPEYVVEKIIAHRTNKKRTTFEYLVRWEGYRPQFNIWEPRNNLRNVPEILGQYRKTHTL